MTLGLATSRRWHDALSEYEQRVLEQMERQLGTDDPKLVSSLQAPSQRPVGRYVLGAFGILLGITLLIVGVSTQMSIIGILGFLAMFLGVVFAVSSPRKGGKQGADDGSAGPPKAPKASVDKSAFMGRMEERWDKRKREQGR